MMRDVVAGSIISFYNGVKLSKEECEEPSEDWRDVARLSHKAGNKLEVSAMNCSLGMEGFVSFSILLSPLI